MKKLSYLLLNRFPYNPGHLLAVPYRDVTELEQLGGHNDALKEVQAEVAEVADTAPAGGPKHA